VHDAPETTDTAPADADVSTQTPPASKAAPREVDYGLDGPARLLTEKCVKDAQNNTARLDRDRQDWLNLLFERGGAENHYVIWDAGTNRWVTRGTDPKKGGLPEWMPRPVTNIYANKIDGIISILNQSEPSQQWKPNTDDDEDLATADVCDNAVEVLRDEIDYDQLRTDINRQITLTDKIAVCIYYDNDEKYGTEDITALQCQACALDPEAEESYFLPMDLPEEASDVCPNCGGPLAEALDPRTNQKLGVTYPIGRMCASFHPGFEFSLPRSARSHRADKNPWILFHARQSWEDAIREFKDKAATLKDRTGWKSSSVQRHYADAMRRLTSPRAATTSAAGGGGQDDGPILYRLYHDPIDDGEFYFPDGLYTVQLNDQLIEAGPLAFKQLLPNGEERPFKNVITRTYRSTPGNPFGKPPADDLVSLQYTRNLLEALLMAILLHHASPRTFLPLSVTLEKPITGVPGEVIPFRSTTPGEVPVTTQGTNPPEGLFKWIEQIDAKFDMLSKLNAVLQGDRPEGNPTLGEIEILKEKGESAFTEPMLEMIRFEKQVSRMLLWIARDTVWTDRLRQVQGDNKAWEIEQFNAADLAGNVDVDIDPASAWPKSNLMDRLKLQELMKMGVFQMFAQGQPELATKILEKYGATEFLPSLDVDRRQVMRELDRWRAARDAAEIRPPDPVVHNLPVHMLYKLAFLKTEEYELLQEHNPPLAMAMRAHVEMIQQTLAMQAAAAAAAANPQPAGKDTGAPSGDALNEAVNSGALAPAKAVKPGLTLEDAIADGVLQPAGAAEAARQASLPSIDELTAAGAMRPVTHASVDELIAGGAMRPAAPDTTGAPR
jgi:hypothetical protein